MPIQEKINKFFSEVESWANGGKKGEYPEITIDLKEILIDNSYELGQLTDRVSKVLEVHVAEDDEEFYEACDPDIGNLFLLGLHKR